MTQTCGTAKNDHSRTHRVLIMESDLEILKDNVDQFAAMTKLTDDHETGPET